jgi:hypothetical protein
MNRCQRRARRIAGRTIESKSTISLFGLLNIATILSASRAPCKMTVLIASVALPRLLFSLGPARTLKVFFLAW